ncbi:hypothetical protein NMY22_g4503 [Coprinellus aureogranulatus]|nr:hypothetical protein NMY22_g4503 [Coprinellus aureogranulatus]
MYSPVPAGPLGSNARVDGKVKNGDLEHRDEWKERLRRRIEAERAIMQATARERLEEDLRNRPQDKDRLLADHQRALKDIQLIAEDQFRLQLEQEREERKQAAALAVEESTVPEAVKQQHAALGARFQQQAEEGQRQDRTPGSVTITPPGQRNPSPRSQRPTAFLQRPPPISAKIPTSRTSSASESEQLWFPKPSTSASSAHPTAKGWTKGISNRSDWQDNRQHPLGALSKPTAPAAGSNVSGSSASPSSSSTRSSPRSVGGIGPARGIGGNRTGLKPIVHPANVSPPHKNELSRPTSYDGTPEMGGGGLGSTSTFTTSSASARKKWNNPSALELARRTGVREPIGPQAREELQREIQCLKREIAGLEREKRERKEWENSERAQLKLAEQHRKEAEIERKLEELRGHAHEAEEKMRHAQKLVEKDKLADEKAEEFECKNKEATRLAKLAEVKFEEANMQYEMAALQRVVEAQSKELAILHKEALHGKKVRLRGLEEDLRIMDHSASPEDELNGVLSSIEVVKVQQDLSPGQLADQTLWHVHHTLSRVIEKKATYRCLLSLTDSKAQMMLDILQMVCKPHLPTRLYVYSPKAMKVLDHSSAAAISNNRRSMLKALLRLSVSTGLYPKCLHLSHQVQKSEEPVDEGSFGDVYRGRIAKQEVAIKVFKVNKRTDLSKLMKTIWREAILWCQLYHANVLPCYGVHQLSSESHRIGLVSPWIESGNVIDYLHHNPLATRLLLLSDIASGIHYLHENKIVHGDLKGANILVSSSGRACLADFGLSTLSDPAFLGWTSIRTTAAKAAGTARWQAPELLDPDDDAEIKITTKSDVYSYGCVCYEIITGSLPFYHIKNNLAVLIHVREGAQPRKPSPEDPAFQKFGLTEGIWDFMVTCWNQDPAERPTALDIRNNPLLTSVVDRRPPQQWGEASASEFRRWAVPSQG